MTRTDHPYAPEYFAEASVYTRQTSGARAYVPVPVLEHLGAGDDDTVVFERDGADAVRMTVAPDGEGAADGVADDGLEWTDLTGVHDE